MIVFLGSLMLYMFVLSRPTPLEYLGWIALFRTPEVTYAVLLLGIVDIQKGVGGSVASGGGKTKVSEDSAAGDRLGSSSSKILVSGGSDGGTILELPRSEPGISQRVVGRWG